MSVGSLEGFGVGAATGSITHFKSRDGGFLNDTGALADFRHGSATRSR